jgi:hypothetical protein
MIPHSLVTHLCLFGTDCLRPLAVVALILAPLGPLQADREAVVSGSTLPRILASDAGVVDETVIRFRFVKATDAQHRLTAGYRPLAAAIEKVDESNNTIQLRVGHPMVKLARQELLSFDQRPDGVRFQCEVAELVLGADGIKTSRLISRPTIFGLLKQGAAIAITERPHRASLHLEASDAEKEKSPGAIKLTAVVLEIFDDSLRRESVKFLQDQTVMSGGTAEFIHRTKGGTEYSVKVTATRLDLEAKATVRE